MLLIGFGMALFVLFNFVVNSDCTRSKSGYAKIFSKLDMQKYFQS